MQEIVQSAAVLSTYSVMIQEFMKFVSCVILIESQWKLLPASFPGFLILTHPGVSEERPSVLSLWEGDKMRGLGNEVETLNTKQNCFRKDHPDIMKQRCLSNSFSIANVITAHYVEHGSKNSKEFTKFVSDLCNIYRVSIGGTVVNKTHLEH